jgi:hypothetical protein
MAAATPRLTRDFAKEGVNGWRRRQKVAERDGRLYVMVNSRGEERKVTKNTEL